MLLESEEGNKIIDCEYMSRLLGWSENVQCIAGLQNRICTIINVLKVVLLILL